MRTARARARPTPSRSRIVGTCCATWARPYRPWPTGTAVPYAGPRSTPPMRRSPPWRPRRSSPLRRPAGRPPPSGPAKPRSRAGRRVTRKRPGCVRKACPSPASPPCSVRSGKRSGAGCASATPRSGRSRTLARIRAESSHIGFRRGCRAGRPCAGGQVEGQRGRGRGEVEHVVAEPVDVLGLVGAEAGQRFGGDGVVAGVAGDGVQRLGHADDGVEDEQVGDEVVVLDHLALFVAG